MSLHATFARRNFQEGSSLAVTVVLNGTTGYVWALSENQRDGSGSASHVLNQVDLITGVILEGTMSDKNCPVPLTI